jgi:hypothetical protein
MCIYIIVKGTYCLDGRAYLILSQMSTVLCPIFTDESARHYGQFLRICVFSVLFADVISWSHVLPSPTHSSCIVQVVDKTGRQVYVCPVCGGQYKFRASLNCHMQTHKIQPMCHICHTVLNRKYDLRRHLRNVHKIDD